MENKRFLNVEYVLLILLSIFLPIFEAPKNLFLILFIAVIFTKFTKKKEKIDFDKYDLIFIFLIASAFLSDLISVSPVKNGMSGFMPVLICAIFGWIISRKKLQYQYIIKIYWALIASALLAALWGLVDINYFHSKDVLELHSIGNSNHSSIYLNFIAGILISLLIYSLQEESRWKIKKTLLIVILIFIIFCIFKTGSRLGLMVLGLNLFILTLSSNLSFALKGKILFSILALLSLFAHLEPSALNKNKIYIQKDNILANRQEIWNLSIEKFKFAPILGSGDKNWSGITQKEIKESIISNARIYDEKKYFSNVDHAHNLYLNVLVERGLVGEFSILYLMIVWLETFLKPLKKINFKANSLIQNASISAWITIFISGFFNTSFQHENALIAILLAGMNMAYAKQKD